MSLLQSFQNNLLNFSPNSYTVFQYKCHLLRLIQKWNLVSLYDIVWDNYSKKLSQDIKEFLTERTDCNKIVLLKHLNAIKTNVIYHAQKSTKNWSHNIEE